MFILSFCFYIYGDFRRIAGGDIRAHDAADKRSRFYMSHYTLNFIIGV